MNIHDALTYAIAVLSGGPEWHEQTAAADALTRLRDALPSREVLQLAAEDPSMLPAHALNQLSDLAAALDA